VHELRGHWPNVAVLTDSSVRFLLLLARQRSVELGYGGRVGLHSLPGSEAFYRRNNVPDYGPDPAKDGLVYFEYAALRP
jgi:hypothetical protein